MVVIVMDFVTLAPLVNLLCVLIEGIAPFLLAQFLTDDASHDTNVLKDVRDVGLIPQLHERFEEHSIPPIHCRAATPDKFPRAKPLKVNRQHAAAVPLDALHLTCHRSVLCFIHRVHSPTARVIRLFRRGEHLGHDEGVGPMVLEEQN